MRNISDVLPKEVLNKYIEMYESGKKNITFGKPPQKHNLDPRKRSQIIGEALV